MCVLDTDGDSDFLIEKCQETNPDNRSRSRFATIKQAYRRWREEFYRWKIEEIREDITEARKRLDGRLKLTCSCFDNYTSTEKRCAVWQDCQDSHTLEHGCCKFSPHHRYRVTLTNPNDGSTQTAILDFRTSEGRKEAFEWLDVTYARFRKNRASRLSRYDKWEETYQKYIQELHVRQRIVLLRGFAPIKWWTTEYMKLHD